MSNITMFTNGHSNGPDASHFLYQEIISCLAVISDNVQKDNLEYMYLDELYEECQNRITLLRESSTNQLVSSSLESLYETLKFQRKLIENSAMNLNEDSSMCAMERSHISSSRQSLGSTTGNNGTSKFTIFHQDANGISFNDIIGLEDVKTILLEAIVMPIQYPNVFRDPVIPWSRVLLYGPPGTGKTRLAKSLATEVRCDLYCISSADLLSSFIGESEKMVRELFTTARESSQKAIIFIDEIDALCRKRTSEENEHSRRIKSELLCQLNAPQQDKCDPVFVLAATNCPWDMDPAFMRRFQKRVFVDLPDRQSRFEMLQHQFKSATTSMNDNEFYKIADKTEGFSGADIAHLGMTAAFIPVREIHTATFWKFTDDDRIEPCSSDTLGAMQCPLNRLPASKVTSRPVQLEDFVEALKSTPKSVTFDMTEKYNEFIAATG